MHKKLSQNTANYRT